MLTLTPNTRIWFATAAADMRMSFRGLSGLVRQRLLDDPTSGHLFCFVNRRRTMMKLLLCDRSGAWIFHRRLARGTFQIPQVEPGAERARLEATELGLILDGIDLASVKRRKRYQRPVAGVLETRT